MSISRLELALKCATRFRPITNAMPHTDREVIIGMGFSANDRNDPRRKPGKSNEEIAEIIYELWNASRACGLESHVLPQREVAEALESRHASVTIAQVLQEVGGESHISSHKILRQAWRYALEKNIHHAIVVAHQAHAWRARLNAELWGFETSFPHRFASSYPPESTQWWTKSLGRFLIWDMLARVKLVLLDRPN